MTSRRRFIQIVPVAGAALLGARTVSAQADMVSEKDPQAVALAGERIERRLAGHAR